MRRTALLLRQLAAVGAAQLITQALGFAASIAVIRLLPVREYAYYTMATAALGTMTVLADGGVSQNVMAFGSRVWRDSSDLGQVIATGVALRRRFTRVAALVGLPIVLLLLIKQNAPAPESAGLIVALLLLFSTSTSGQLFEIAPRLHQKLGALQRVQIAGAAIRCAALIAISLPFPKAAFAMLAAAGSQAWTNRRLRRLTWTFADQAAQEDPQVKRAIYSRLPRILPGTIYYAFSGQISIWLISILSSTESVAQLGALGRLSAVFNIFGAILSLVFIPRFARLPHDSTRSALVKFWIIQIGLTACLAAFIGLVAELPGLAEAIFGSKYAQLADETLLACANGAVALLAGSAYHLAASRNVVTSPWLVIPLNIILQVALIYSLPVNTVFGGLCLGALTNLGLWFLYVGYFSMRSRDSFSSMPHESKAGTSAAAERTPASGGGR